MSLAITVHTPQTTVTRCASCAGGSHKPHHFRGATWHVPSSDGSRMYTVVLHAGQASCTCPDATYRHRECKHVEQARFEASKLTASSFDLFDGDEIPAPKSTKPALRLEDLFVA